MDAVSVAGRVGRMVMALALAQVSVGGSELYEVTSGRVVVGCPLTVGGRFDVTTPSVSGQVMVDERARELVGAFVVDLRTLDAGIGLRTTHMKDNYLEIGRGPTFATAVLTNIVLDAAPEKVPNGPVGFRGQLTLHGQTRQVTGNVDLSRKANRFDIKVRFVIRIDAFHIAKPTYLGLGVSNDIEVTVRASLQSVAGPSR